MIPRALVVWCALLVLAFLNGALREVWIVPRFGATPGHVLSTLLLACAVLVVAWFTVEWIRPAAPGDAAGIGLMWVGLTLAFEFGAGHYLFGAPWETLLADYDITAGRIWPLVLVATFAAPLLSVALRGGYTRYAPKGIFSPAARKNPHPSP